jgi:hypothetical protein
MSKMQIATVLAEVAGFPDWLSRGIAAAQTANRQTAISGRIPYTYAYDFVRSHPAAFAAPERLSRGKTSAWLSDNLGLSGVEDDQTRDYICAVLCVAYLEEHNLRLDDEGAARLDGLLGKSRIINVADHPAAVTAPAPEREAAES